MYLCKMLFCVAQYTYSKATGQGYCKRKEKKKQLCLVSHACLEVVPFCGFNTQPHHCALVSAAIPSNLATLYWILCKVPSVLWERHSLFNTQRAYSGARGNLESPRPRTNGDRGGNISLSLSHGEKGQYPRGLAPFPPHQLLLTATSHLPQQMCFTPLQSDSAHTEQ